MNTKSQSPKSKFTEYQIELRQKFRNTCRRIHGENGSARLADMAWYIAVNAPAYYPYLYGDKMGTDESYIFLLRAKEDALGWAKMLHEAIRCYNAGMPIVYIDSSSVRNLMVASLPSAELPLSHSSKNRLRRRRLRFILAHIFYGLVCGLLVKVLMVAAYYAFFHK